MKPFALALAFLALLVLAVAGYGDRAARAAPDGKTGLKLVFSDDFGGTGAPDASKWSLYDGPGHNGNGLRCPEAFSQADGVLTVTAQMKRVTGCGQAPDAANPPTLVSGGMRPSASGATSASSRARRRSRPVRRDVGGAHHVAEVLQPGERADVRGDGLLGDRS